ncbi:MAG: FtsH protease activity modulator HflK [Phycisphaerales bacterium]|nr:MAG: FtsH protease activity modulator HflK [Phycisphaerales bacterium]
MSRTRLLSWCLVLGAVTVYLASGFYFVRPEERAVVRWFGRIPDGRREVEPGLHYAPPWPTCRIDKLTIEVRRVYVGLLPEQREAITRGDIAAITASPASDMLTGDNNILKVTMVVQYRVSDPAAYLTGSADPDGLVRNTVQAALVQTLAALPVDKALTTAKVRLQNETVRQAQTLLNEYGCGVRLAGARLNVIDPPHAVADAFNEVLSAKKDGERVVDEALAQANTILPRARGQAARITQEAEAYRVSNVNRARGDADRFVSVLAEYVKAPRVTRDRLWLQTFETVLPRVRVYVLDNREGEAPANIKIIDATGQ